MFACLQQQKDGLASKIFKDDGGNPEQLERYKAIKDIEEKNRKLEAEKKKLEDENKRLKDENKRLKKNADTCTPM